MARKKKPKDKLTRKQRAAARKRRAERPQRYVTIIGSHKTNTWFVKLVDGMEVVTAPLVATQIEVAYRDARIVAAKYGVEFDPDRGLPAHHKDLEIKDMSPRDINDFYRYDGPLPKGPKPPLRSEG
jgi:hypothetical protein